MKTIIVLGAADGALSTYRTAAEMGYRTIAVDWSPSAPAVALADEYLPLSTRDVPGILDALGDRKDLAGVLAPSSDIAVPTQGELAAKLGLGEPPTGLAVRSSVDKWVAREVLDELGISSYRWVQGDDPQQLIRTAKGMAFPIVVKPADAQGGRGVTRCTTAAQVDDAVHEAQRSSYGGRVMVEEEIIGVHCGCECIVEDGQVAFLAMTRRELSPPPLALTVGHTMPTGLPASVEDAVRSAVDKLCARIGYRTGPLNLDLVVTPDGEPFIIELGLRTGGNGLDDLVRHCYGVDPVRAAIQAALGLPLDLAPHAPRPVSWRVLTAQHAGELTAVTGADRVREMSEVTEFVVLAKPGQQVRPHEVVSDRLGWVVLHADTVTALDAAAERVHQTLRFTVAPATGR